VLYFLDVLLLPGEPRIRTKYLSVTTSGMVQDDRHLASSPGSLLSFTYIRPVAANPAGLARLNAGAEFIASLLVLPLSLPFILNAWKNFSAGALLILAVFVLDVVGSDKIGWHGVAIIWG